MRLLLTSKQMKETEAATMEYFGLPSLVLMERAALSVVAAIHEEGYDSSNTIVLCGIGNNGGDGLAIARLLLLAGKRVQVVILGNPAKMTEECKQQYEIFQRYIEELDLPNACLLAGEEFSAKDTFYGKTLIIDAIFGIGLSRPITGIYETWMKAAIAHKCAKVAVDIPSGVSADTGALLGDVICADLTVTFGYAKVGQYLYPGRAYCGKCRVAKIGIDEISRQKAQVSSTVKALDAEVYSLLPKRFAGSNKGTYGKLAIFSSCKNMAGAAVFAASAAYRTGAGLVTVVSEECNREIIQKSIPEAVLKTPDSLTEIDEIANKATCMVLGPGIGMDELQEQRLLHFISHSKGPLVMDADALNLMAKSDELEKAVASYEGDVILTPHLGEAARLLGKSVSEISDDLLFYANTIAKKYHAICVLKDAATVIASEDGHYYINTSGNNGMSTGGSGDVLAGIIGGLLAQKADALDAALLGVYMHGEAGDLAAEDLVQQSVTATDIYERINRVLKRHQDEA